MSSTDLSVTIEPKLTQTVTVVDVPSHVEAIVAVRDGSIMLCRYRSTAIAGDVSCVIYLRCPENGFLDLRLLCLDEDEIYDFMQLQVNVLCNYSNRKQRRVEAKPAG